MKASGRVSSPACFLMIVLYTGRTGSSAHLARGFQCGAQHLFDYIEIDVFRFRIADRTLSEADSWHIEQIAMREHHIGTQDVETDKILLVRKADLNNTVARITRASVCHRLSESDQGLSTEFPQAPEGRLPGGRRFFDVSWNGLGGALHFRLDPGIVQRSEKLRQGLCKVWMADLKVPDRFFESPELPLRTP